MTGFITWPQPREEALGPDLEWSYVREEISMDPKDSAYCAAVVFGEPEEGVFPFDLKIEGVIYADDGSIIPEKYYAGSAHSDRWKRLGGPILWAVQEWLENSPDEIKAYEKWAVEHNKEIVRAPNLFKNLMQEGAR